MEKLYYTITEVSKLLDIKPYVIRYWETEFPQIRRSRKSGRNRRYNQKEYETICIIKDLLYDKKYTIKGAKQALKDNVNPPVNEAAPKEITSPQQELKNIKDLLGKIKKIVEEFKHK